MRRLIRALGPLVLLLAVLGGASIADSWVPPQRLVSLAADGRTFVVVEPQSGLRATFRLVERRRGAPKHPETLPVGPGQGDKILATGECTMPLGVHCLSGKKGFVLFETYGRVGTGVVAARYDAKGGIVWTRKLLELFTPEEVSGFTSTMSSILWFETHGLDEGRGDLVIVHEKTAADASPAPPPDPDLDLGEERAGAPGVLRIALEDGKVKPGKAEDLLRLLQIHEGRREARLLALDAASRAGPKGYIVALRRILAKSQEDRAVRVMAAVYLHRAGDDRGRDVVVDAARSGVPSDVRKYALEHLPELLDLEAIVYLRGALREADAEMGMAIWRALSSYGARAVDDLTRMVNEPGTSPSYRSTAIQLLAQLGADAAPALEALKVAAKDKADAVAENARFAIQMIQKNQRAAPR